MKINGKELKHNERITLSQIEYLEERYQNLVNYLERKFSDLYFSLDTSRQSEAGYINVSNEKGESITISIRNHSNFAKSDYDKSFFLSEYENWIEIKKEIISYVNEFSIKGESLVFEEQRKMFELYNLVN